MADFEENEGEEHENSQESEEKPPEKRIFQGENFSDEENEKESKKQGPAKPIDELDMMELIQRRSKSREPTNVIVHRGDLIKAQTLGMSVSPSAIKPGEVKQRVKLHTTRLLRVLNRYREIDESEYQNFKQCKVDDERVEKVFHNFYLLHKKFAAKALIYVLNSYDETGICRLFQEFYLEFDQNNDKKMQIDELEKCIEFLGKDNYIGQKKMIETLKEYNVNCSNSLSLFQEGNAGKILNDETLNKLFKTMEFEGGSKKQSNEEDFVDFMKFAPMLSIFFFEYFVTNYLKRKELFRMYLGFPIKYKYNGKAIIDPEGDPEGLYRVFIAQLKGESSITDPIVTFKDVSNALIIYRSSGFSDAISMEAIERILKQVKELMEVDPISDKESRKFSLQELLPILVCKIATEMTWHKNLFRKSIEKYDKMVEWHGCALSINLTKENIHNLLNDAFSNLPFPTFEQFVKGLDFVLKKLIPTLVSPASIFIAKKLMKTPDTIITEEGFNGEVRVRFNIKYITTNDDLFERLFYFSTRFQIKLMFVRMLYKNFYPNYRREKEINSMIGKYNQIMTTFELFEFGDPGKLGNFEDTFLNILKSGDPEEQVKEENARKEMKKKKFLEMIFNQDDIAAEKRKSRMNLVRRKSSVRVSENNNAALMRRKKDNTKNKLDVLLAEANRIDTNINKREAEKLKDIQRSRVTSAFPNTEDITPEIIMNLINNSSNKSQDIEKLKEFIYYEKEKIGFQDIQKFIIAQHIKKFEEKESEKLMSIKTVYTQKDVYEEQLKTSAKTENNEENPLKSKNSLSEKFPLLEPLKSGRSSQLKSMNTVKSSQLNTNKSLQTDSGESSLPTEDQDGENPENPTKSKDEVLENTIKETQEDEEFDQHVYVHVGNSEEFEEKYFKDFANRKRNEASKVKEKYENKEDKDRGCECVLS